MPVTIDVDHVRRSLRISYAEPIGVGDLLDAQLKIATEGAWTYSVLLNCGDLSWLPTSDEVRAIVNQLEGLAALRGKRGPMAIVTGPREGLFGMARMYATLSAERFNEIRVFRRADEAERWLTSLTAAPAS